VSGVSNKKFQITKHKKQTNNNDRNSKFQTINGIGFYVVSHERHRWPEKRPV